MPGFGFDCTGDAAREVGTAAEGRRERENAAPVTSVIRVQRSPEGHVALCMCVGAGGGPAGGKVQNSTESPRHNQ